MYFHLALDRDGGWNHKAIRECQVSQRMADGRYDARGEQSVIQQVTRHHEVAAHWDVGAEEDVAGSLIDHLSDGVGYG